MIKELANQRATVIYGLLVLLTAVSFWLTVGHGSSLIGEGVGAKIVWTQIIVLAFIKVRWVILDFMELRSAPWGLRLLYESWAVGVAALLIILNYAVG